MPNEHIEYFKRFAAAYLEWVNFRFDRTVAEIVKKHSQPKPMKFSIVEYIPTGSSFNFERDVTWGIKVIPPHDLNILKG